MEIFGIERHKNFANYEQTKHSQIGIISPASNSCDGGTPNETKNIANEIKWKTEPLMNGLKFFIH